MTTKITIDYDVKSVIVHVIDGTGRDQTKVFPRYPDPDSAPYIRFADALDVMMAEPTVIP